MTHQHPSAEQVEAASFKEAWYHGYWHTPRKIDMRAAFLFRDYLKVRLNNDQIVIFKAKRKR